MTHPKSVWYNYIIECKTGTWYCGVTNNLERRFQRHASGKGSKYIRGQGGPKMYVYYRMAEGKSQAFSIEQRMKRLNRVEKAELIASEKNELIQGGSDDLLRLQGKAP